MIFFGMVYLSAENKIKRSNLHYSAFCMPTLWVGTCQHRHNALKLIGTLKENYVNNL
jgi:hypothetical protein